MELRLVKHWGYFTFTYSYYSSQMNVDTTGTSCSSYGGNEFKISLGTLLGDRPSGRL